MEYATLNLLTHYKEVTYGFVRYSNKLWDTSLVQNYDNSKKEYTQNKRSSGKSFGGGSSSGGGGGGGGW